MYPLYHGLLPLYAQKHTRMLYSGSLERLITLSQLVDDDLEDGRKAGRSRRRPSMLLSRMMSVIFCMSIGYLNSRSQVADQSGAKERKRALLCAAPQTTYFGVLTRSDLSTELPISAGDSVGAVELARIA